MQWVLFHLLELFSFDHDLQKVFMGLFQAIQVLDKPRVAIVQGKLKQSQYRVLTLYLIELENLNSDWP